MTSEHSPGKEILGMFLLLLASLSISASAALVKLAYKSMTVFEIIFYQSLGQFILACLGCFILKINPSANQVMLQLLGGLFGAGTFILGFWGTVNMELSDGTILKFSAPLLTMLMAKLYLKEEISWFKRIGMLIGFIGVLLTARPSFLFSPIDNHLYPNRNWAILSVLGASICLACSTIITKQIAHQVHYFSLMFFLSTWYLFISILLKFSESNNFQFQGISLVILLTIGFFCGQVFGFIGISHVPATVTTLIKNMDTFFGVIFGIVIFKESLQWNTIVGCILVFIVTILLVIENIYQTRVDKERERENSNKTVLNETF
eukprot:NODE_452_length_7258_cov_0.721050.p3 type:complete len:319 gc:universal NODE_452_length_7258_cov_0.721050:6277-7233(+)